MNFSNAQRHLEIRKTITSGIAVISYSKYLEMQRLTTRLLLLAMLIGAFAPLVEAFSAQQPHACCLRKLHARNDLPLEVSDNARRGNCCPPLTTPHTAELQTFGRTFVFHSFALPLAAADSFYAVQLIAGPSSRAPPSKLL